MGYTKIQISRILDKYGLTNFQKKVLLETLKIPKGRTASYKEIAVRIGYPNAYRAVGTALSKNPLPVVIPCHRVILSNGKIGNYSAGGPKKKLALLNAERAAVNRAHSQ